MYFFLEHLRTKPRLTQSFIEYIEQAETNNARIPGVEDHLMMFIMCFREIKDSISALRILSDISVPEGCQEHDLGTSMNLVSCQKKKENGFLKIRYPSLVFSSREYRIHYQQKCILVAQTPNFEYFGFMILYNNVWYDHQGQPVPALSKEEVTFKSKRGSRHFFEDKNGHFLSYDVTTKRLEENVLGFVVRPKGKERFACDVWTRFYLTDYDGAQHEFSLPSDLTNLDGYSFLEYDFPFPLVRVRENGCWYDYKGILVSVEGIVSWSFSQVRFANGNVFITRNEQQLINYYSNFNVTTSSQGVIFYHLQQEINFSGRVIGLEKIVDFAAETICPSWTNNDTFLFVLVHTCVSSSLDVVYIYRLDTGMFVRKMTLNYDKSDPGPRANVSADQWFLHSCDQIFDFNHNEMHQIACLQNVLSTDIMSIVKSYIII